MAVTKALRVDATKRFRCPQCLNHVCRHADDPLTRWTKAFYMCHKCELTWPVEG